jgi:uncharacterized membrane protein HdeD (DUF308 family)
MTFSGSARRDSPEERELIGFGLNATIAPNWSAVALRGILGLIIGLIAFLFPGPALLSLVALFALYLIIDGTFAIAAAVRAGGRDERWVYFIFVGIIAGLAALAWPRLTALVFVGLLAAWGLVSGMLELRAAFHLSKEHGRWWLVLGAIASIVFGSVLVIAPRFGGLVVSWCVGAYATVFGASLIALAFQLRSHGPE